MVEKDAPLDRFRRATARRLRAKATGAERKLWRYLRQMPAHGTHFRRQVPVGPYVADFACLASRLIIEVDGSQHGATKNERRDEIRTRWLQSEGHRVLRVWNDDVTENIGGVMEAIYAALHGSTMAEPNVLKHQRRGRAMPMINHPTPARPARRPSPSRGG